MGRVTIKYDTVKVKSFCKIDYFKLKDILKKVELHYGYDLDTKFCTIYLDIGEPSLYKYCIKCEDLVINVPYNTLNDVMKDCYITINQVSLFGHLENPQYVDVILDGRKHEDWIAAIKIFIDNGVPIKLPTSVSIRQNNDCMYSIDSLDSSMYRKDITFAEWSRDTCLSYHVPKYAVIQLGSNFYDYSGQLLTNSLDEALEIVKLYKL